MRDYDTFMRMPVPERRRLWTTFQVSEVVALLSTHRRRWLEQHRRGLTPQQCAVLEEDIAFIQNELAHVSTNPECAKHQRELLARVHDLLPPEIIEQLALVPRHQR